MISELHLENIQSHKVSTFEFSKGINVIIGSSNSGKTAVIRGLIYALHNVPLGTSMMRHGAKHMSSSVIFDEGWAVSHFRDSKKHVYELVNAETEHSFTAFGASVPEEIKAVIRMTDINIQSQLAPHFLVLDSPGQVAKFIRSSAGLDDIDSVVSALHSRMLKVNQKIEMVDTQEKALFLEVTELEELNLPKLEKSVALYESATDRLDTLCVSNNTLDTLLFTINTVESAIIELPDTLDDDISMLQTSISRHGELVGRTQQLVSIAQDIDIIHDDLSGIPEDLEDTILHLSKLVDAYAVVNHSFASLSRLAYDLGNVLVAIEAAPGNLEVSVAKLHTAIYELEIRQNDLDDIFEIVSDIDTCEDDLSMVEMKYRTLIKEEKQLRSQLSECPTCGQALTDEAKLHMLENGVST